MIACDVSFESVFKKNLKKNLKKNFKETFKRALEKPCEKTAEKTSEAALEIQGLTYHYKQRAVLADFNLTIAPGEIACILGHSGCGKTTLLNLISGQSRPDVGIIRLNGQPVSSPTQVMPPERRGIGMIFQDYALFPHLTVVDNIGFGLKGLSSCARKQRIDRMLELVSLQAFGHRYPHQLSGGQQQRVAIARALACKPRLLLLDEPFSNIDHQVRQQLITEIRTILKQQQVAALFVTHCHEEGCTFADRLAIMAEGRIIQSGSAYGLYHAPASPFVARFLKAGNCIPARRLDKRRLLTFFGEIESTTDIVLKGAALDHGESDCLVFLRHENTIIKPGKPASGEPLVIHNQCFLGNRFRSELSLNGTTITVEHSQPVDKQVPVTLSCPPHPLVVFGAQSIKTTGFAST